MKEIKSLLKAVGYAAACYLTYGAILFGVQAISHCNSPKITSRSQLENLVVLERNRVGIGDNISINLVDDTYAKYDTIGHSSKSEVIDNFEKYMIERFMGLDNCDNEQIGGGEMTESDKYIVYVMFNK